MIKEYVIAVLFYLEYWRLIKGKHIIIDLSKCRYSKADALPVKPRQNHTQDNS